jgi:hypothetical protein
MRIRNDSKGKSLVRWAIEYAVRTAALILIAVPMLFFGMLWNANVYDHIPQRFRTYMDGIGTQFALVIVGWYVVLLASETVKRVRGDRSGDD